MSQQLSPQEKAAKENEYLSLNNEEMKYFNEVQRQRVEKKDRLDTLVFEERMHELYDYVFGKDDYNPMLGERADQAIEIEGVE